MVRALIMQYGVVCIDFVVGIDCVVPRSSRSDTDESRSQATDKCYQCSTDVPFCHWQTYVEAGQPTLRWFSCISTRMGDETLFASTITNSLLGPSPSGSTNSTSSSSSSLSTGDIAGIAVAGAVAIIACVAIVSIACVRVRRKKEQPAPPGTDADPNSPQPQPGYAAASPMSTLDAKPAPPPFQQQYAYEMPVAEPQELPGAGVVAGPEGAAKLDKYAGRDGAAVPVAEMPDTAHEARWSDQGQGQWDAHQQQQQQLTPPPGQGQAYAPSPHFTPPPPPGQGQGYVPSPHFTPPPGEQGFAPPPPQQQMQPGYGYGQADPQHERQYSR
jgi:hypothetical protein